MAESDLGKAFGDALTEDFEFQRLWIMELEKLRANKHHLPEIVKNAYIALQGDPQSVRAMFSILFSKYAQRKMEKIDLPGPDALYKDKILGVIQKFGEEAFDEFFQPKP